MLGSKYSKLDPAKWSLGLVGIADAVGDGDVYYVAPQDGFITRISYVMSNTGTTSGSTTFRIYRAASGGGTFADVGIGDKSVAYTVANFAETVAAVTDIKVTKGDKLRLDVTAVPGAGSPTDLVVKLNIEYAPINM